MCNITRDGIAMNSQSICNLGNWLKIEKLLLGLYDREMNFYLKFKPANKKFPRPNKKLVKKIIQELAFADFNFMRRDDLIKEIIRKTKCNVGDASSIESEMVILGLNYSAKTFSQDTSMLEFAKLCGYLSPEECLQVMKHQKKIKQKQDQKEEKMLARYE